MITVLLLDLDDTLLGNPNSTFIPAYLRLLADRLADQFPADSLISALQASTAAALSNRDARQTLRQVFEVRFRQLMGRGLFEAAERLGRFYRDDYPTLAPLTTVRPEARDLVQWAFAQGLKVAIATNPVYPLTAIAQRLEWAEVSMDEFDYTIVPSLDTMHFGKPRPEYFAELTARVGCRPGEALMVGDDWANDIAPAAQAGLNTFWIAPPGAQPPAEAPRPDGRGSLADFVRWARDARCLETLQPLPPTPASSLAGLRGNLAAFVSAAHGVADWKRQPAQDEWSLTEILCHLRDVEAEVNLPRLARLASETEPFVPVADTDPWARERNYQAQDGPAALRDFAQARQATLDFLEPLPPEFWSRPARHSILGRTTPTELVTFTLEHDRIHLAQIAALEPGPNPAGN